jgi:hypothetical protein
MTRTVEHSLSASAILGSGFFRSASDRLLFPVARITFRVEEGMIRSSPNLFYG